MGLSRSSMGRRASVGGFENDAFSRWWRRWQRMDRKNVAYAKRQSNKRERRIGRREAEDGKHEDS